MSLAAIVLVVVVGIGAFWTGFIVAAVLATGREADVARHAAPMT